MRLLIGLGFGLALAVGCGDGGDHESYPTFQACFDEHTIREGFNPTQAITICVLSHPVDGTALEFATAAECVTYVGANLMSASATAVEIQGGCDEYIRQKDM